MPRILLTSGIEDWRKLLADGENQWKLGYSARALASCWEAANGFPAEIVLTESPDYFYSAFDAYRKNLKVMGKYTEMIK